MRKSKPDTDPSNPAVALHLESAMEAIGGENFREALDSLNRAIVDADDVQLGECYAMRGFVRLRLHQHSDAEDDCSHSIRLRGQDAETLAWRAAARGELRLWRRAFEDLDQARRLDIGSSGKYSQLMESYLPPAIEWIQREIQSGNRDPQLFFDRGWIYMLCGEREKAKRDFDQVLQHRDDHGHALVGLARLSLGDGNPPTAIRYASQALQCDESALQEALTCRARAYAAAGKLDEATEDVNRLREKIGSTGDGLIVCAGLRKELGDLVGAIGDLDLAEQMNHALTNLLMLRGEVYSAMHNYPMALANYSQYLRRVPSNELVWVRRGNLFLQQGELDQARADFDRALECDDICAPAYLGRCHVYFLLDNYAQALMESERALRLDSRNSQIHTQRGKIYHAQQRYRQAIADFDMAKELADDDAEQAQILYLRGISHFELDNAPAAIDDFKEASVRRPTHAGTLIWRAVTSAKLEDWPDVIEQLHNAVTLRPSAAEQYRVLGSPVAEKAIEYFNRLVREKQTSATLYRRRARAHQFLGQYDEAISDFTVALSSEKKDLATRVQRAQLFAEQGKTEKALHDLNKVIQYDPACDQAYFTRASACLSAGIGERAFEDVARAIELQPNRPRYYMLRGKWLFNQGRIDDAISDFSQAISLDPYDHLAFRARGECYLKRSELLAAVADLTRSIELFGNDAQSFVVRGDAYLEHNQFELAEADFERASALNPKLAGAYVGSAKCLAKANRHEQGLILLTKALHRFESNRDLAELITNRARIFYRMGRLAPAITDFSSAIELQRGDRRAVAAARCARAVVLVQDRQLQRAKREFDRVLKRFPQHANAREAAAWLATGQGPRPDALKPPKELIRPTRPPVLGQGEQPDLDDDRWDAPPPFDLWIVRTKGDREYGPVSKSVLDDWVKQGRIDGRTRLLKSGWPKWRRAHRIYECLES